MTAQDYILSTLQALKQPVVKEDIGTTPLEDAVYAKVMSKKFRKIKADDVTVTMAKNAIHTAVTAKAPITVSFLFGGNKLWRFDEAPEIDWAEFFALTYFLRWMKTIASVYPHGVRLDFYSEAIAVETLNNVSREEVAEYAKTFTALIEWLQPYIPEGITITFREYANEYNSYDEYLSELEAAKIKHLKDNNGELPSLTPEQALATELNVRPLPGQTIDPQWREKVELIHRSLEETPAITKAYFNDPMLIMACPTVYSGWIAVGSTKHSYAKFWAAVGALRTHGDTYDELVLTPKQLAEAKFDWQDIDLGLQGKNFSKIRVLP